MTPEQQNQAEYDTFAGEMAGIAEMALEGRILTALVIFVTTETERDRRLASGMEKKTEQDPKTVQATPQLLMFTPDPSAAIYLAKIFAENVVPALEKRVAEDF